MAVTTSPSPDPGATTATDQLLRFDRVERLAHWLTALCFLVLIATGAALYVPALVDLVGRRALVERIHVDTGLALALPLIVSLSGSWGRGLRADLRRINRWSVQERYRVWLALRGRPREDLPVGKFNAGQKLNAAFVAGVILVMLMTGSIMRWSYFFPLSWRTGATFVHDTVAILLTVVVAGHVAMALSHPASLRSMITGKVSRSWAARHAPLWLQEVEGGATSEDAAGAPEASVVGPPGGHGAAP
jgi:formate dehydrogenase subunit gamma